MAQYVKSGGCVVHPLMRRYASGDKMKKEQEFYRERTVGLLTNFQLLELSLKMYIGKSYDFIHALVGDRIHFGFRLTM